MTSELNLESEVSKLSNLERLKLLRSVQGLGVNDFVASANEAAGDRRIVEKMSRGIYRKFENLLKSHGEIGGGVAGDIFPDMEIPYINPHGQADCTMKIYAYAGGGFRINVWEPSVNGKRSCEKIPGLFVIAEDKILDYRRAWITDIGVLAKVEEMSEILVKSAKKVYPRSPRPSASP